MRYSERPDQRAGELVADERFQTLAGRGPYVVESGEGGTVLE